MTELIDIGANLAHKSFRGDLAEVIERARRAGVVAMVVTGTTVRASTGARSLAAARPGTLYSTAGVHPHEARSCDGETIGALRALAAHPEVVAVGECGLDYDRDFSPRDVQRRWFERQLELGVETKKPVFLHERAAHDDFVRILSRFRRDLLGGVVHCFTGSGDALDAYLELDLHVGITGWICDERRGTHLLDLVERIPADRLMIETDSPFLIPRTIHPRPRTRRNEPANLPHVLATVADATGRPPATVAAQTTATARRFFGLDAGSGDH